MKRQHQLTVMAPLSNTHPTAVNDGDTRRRFVARSSAVPQRQLALRVRENPIESSTDQTQHNTRWPRFLDKAIANRQLVGSERRQMIAYYLLTRTKTSLNLLFFFSKSVSPSLSLFLYTPPPSLSLFLSISLALALAPALALALSPALYLSCSHPISIYLYVSLSRYMFT